MGPRSFIRGNLIEFDTATEITAGLQWGHGVLSVEMPLKYKKEMLADWLQWGHGVLSVEMAACSIPDKCGDTGVEIESLHYSLILPPKNPSII